MLCMSLSKVSKLPEEVPTTKHSLNIVKQVTVILGKL